MPASVPPVVPEDNVKAHPLVQALAGMSVSLPRVEALDEAALDDRDDLRATCPVLDADGSQRLCLDAAAHGESFVLIGPPGTGKSQTIANLIADAVAHGRTVLFVSDKIVALEVVARRLHEVGLSECCLELHGDKANAQPIIAELARCLQTRGQVQAPGPSDDAIARLRKRRDQLNGYVRALHQVREPMHKCAWEVLAELPRWRGLPLIPLNLPASRAEGGDATGLTLAEFTAAHLDELRGLLQKLQTLWHVGTEHSFPWRGFKADRYSQQLRDDVLGLIDRIRGRGDKLRAAADEYGKQLGVSGSVAGLLKLGDLLEKRPGHVEPGWFTVELDALTADLERCADQYQRLAQARRPLTERYGPALWQLADQTAVRLQRAWQDVAILLAPQDERGAGFLAQQQKLRAWAAETQKRVPAWLTELRTLDKWLALPIDAGAGAASKSTLDPSTEAVRHFSRLVTLCQSDHPAERRWLEDTHALASALALTSAARAASSGYRHQRAALMQKYSEKLFDLDLAKMAAGFAGPYRTWVRYFRRGYWRACSRLARVSRSGMLPPSHAHDVLAARDAAADRAVLEAELAKYPGVLGRYDKGLDTDMDAADNAAKLASEAISLARSLGHAPLPAKLADALVSGSPPEKVRASLKRLNESFAGWAHMTEALHGVLPLGRVPGVGERLEACALSALVQYAKELQAALNQFAVLADPVLRQTTPADVPTLVADLKQAEEVRAFEAGQEAEARRWASRFGAGFQGVGTDWEALRKGLAWARRVRDCLTALNGKQGGALTQTPPPVRDLRQAFEQYEHALHHLEVRFEPPGPRLAGKPLREHGPDEVLDHLARLRDDVGTLADWIDWRHLPERFHHLGLGAYWDRLTDADVPRDQVADVFTKAFWSAWLDSVVQHDPALAGFRRSEHERAIADFQDLDRQLLRQNTTRVLRRLHVAPIAPDSPAVKLLLGEAAKQTGQLPLPRLVDEMPELLVQLKPCLLMNPLAVSEFLPGDPAKLQFDVVVFDEASQLAMEDAIPAICRATQMVIVGDPQQLPPPRFFQQLARTDQPVAAEEPPSESVLDAALAAGLPRRTLRVHYRSRDEALIAFANERFYDGKLITFPSPRHGDAARAVRFHHVADAVHDSGRVREAEVIADLVLEHLRTTPDKTLGVVALSDPQLAAIEDALPRRLREHSELEKRLNSDRLSGFFVKNVEMAQGDERDVILLSISHGRDEGGKLNLDVSPLNCAGGERCLNVAVTRACEQLLVVSSIRAADIALPPGAAPGLTHLRQFLDYAERAFDALPTSAAAVAPPTALHTDVQRALKEHGYDSVAQVGCGAERIDVGVLAPDRPDAFLLGIEFDGPAYHAATTTRDRDRLRPEVLTTLGWRLHRIWAVDWLHRRDEEVQRLLQAITRAQSAN